LVHISGFLDHLDAARRRRYHAMNEREMGRREAARRLLDHDDEINVDTAAGYWMEMVHGGDTDVGADWREAFAEARKCGRRPEGDVSP